MRDQHDMRCSSNYGPAPCDCVPPPIPVPWSIVEDEVARDLSNEGEQMSRDLKIDMAAKKAPLDMVPEAAIVGAARVFQYGAKKYAAGNFLQASIADGAVGRYIGAVRRHLREMQDLTGLFTFESSGHLDNESGLPHIDHAICSLIMLRAILIKEKALSEDPSAWVTPRVEPRHDLAVAPSIYPLRPTGPGETGTK